MKISYVEDWDNMGTHYNQRVTLRVEDMVKVNTVIKNKLIESDDYMDMLYLKYLDLGDNYTTLTTSWMARCVMEYLGHDVSRWLERNTVIRVVA